MRFIQALSAAALATAFVAGTAGADPKAPDRTNTESMAAGDCARAHAAGRTCVLSIEAEEINGSVVTPGEQNITAPTFGKAPSLIKLRLHFIPEIIKSAEDL